MSTHDAGANMSDPQEAGGWITAAVTTIIAAVTSAIAYLYKKVEEKSREAIEGLRCEVKELKDLCSRQQKDIDDCKEDRAELKTKVALLEASVCPHHRGNDDNCTHRS